MKTSEVGFDLKAPCADCPFRKATPFDEALLSDLPNQMASIAAGHFIHTCHKTDARAVREGEPPAKLVNGKVQHCVGAILMCEKSGQSQMPYLTAHVTGKLNVEALHGATEVSSVKEFLKKYMDGIKKLIGTDGFKEEK